MALARIFLMIRSAAKFTRRNRLAFDLYTHDIYLNDSRKTKTENLKAIMRIGVHKK